MTIFSFLTMIGGLAFFLFGMNIMSSNLEKVAGGKLEVVLQRLTSNLWKSLALGAAITIAIQSSSALTVMLVGLVNSGIMELGNTVGAIMGADIGTTLTAWILSLSGIQSDNIFMSLLKPANFSPIVALIGVGLIMEAKQQKKKDIGAILCGFAVLMFGMTLMSQAVEPLAESEQFTSMLTAFDNPVLGLLIGTVFTGIIQSSAASIGILQALSLTGTITYGAAIPLIMGLNIGTCMTALLSSIGVSTDAKRVAGIHIAIKVLGAIIAFIPFVLIRQFVDLPILSQTINPVAIAAIHSVYNIMMVLILLPFNQLIVKLIKKIVRGKKGEEAEEKFRGLVIDERLYNSPNIVISQCKESTIEMAHLAYESFSTSLSAFEEYDEEKMDRINKCEKKLDVLEDSLNSILIRLSARDLTDQLSSEVNEIPYCIREFERIGDYGVNMVNNAKSMVERKVVFSDNANKEIAVLNSAVRQILQMTVDAFEHDDEALAAKVEPLEQVIDNLTETIKARHIDRLRYGDCRGDTGIVLDDYVTFCSRVSDHCSNTAVTIIQTRIASRDAHQYLNKLKKGNDAEYQKNYADFEETFQLPDYVWKKNKKKAAAAAAAKAEAEAKKNAKAEAAPANA